MAGVSRNKSLIRVILATALSIKYFLPLAIVSNVITILNVLVSLEVSVSASEIFNSEINIEKSKTPLLLLLRSFIGWSVLHYLLSSVLQFLKETISISMYQKSVGDAVGDTTDMVNAEYHSRGHGRCQDDIEKSSWAVYDITSLTFLDIPQGAVHCVIYSLRFAALMHKSVAILYILAMFLCTLSTVFITNFLNANETYFVSLYKNSLLVLSDILRNFDIVQAYGKEHSEAQRFSASLHPFVKSVINFGLVRELLSFTQKVLLVVPHFILIYFFFSGYDLGLAVKDFVLYNLLFFNYKKNFLSVKDNLFKLSKYFADAGCRLDVKKQNEGGSSTLYEIRDGIEAREMELRVGEVILNEKLNFKINVREKVAITGNNGTGKSTFIKTLLRFHENGGTLLVDGTPIEELNVSSLRQLIAYVPQEPHIMNNTVLFNLCYAQDKANEEAVYELCKAYGCHEFFLSMANGYQTITGENGVYLSGGQKQRINFMRAIIRGSPIILLDEPTSNLDKQTEAGFIKDIVSKAHDKTVIVVLHNLDLLRHFDKILLFKKSDVVTYSSYEEYLRSTQLQK